MSSKISALTAATDAGNADLLTVVQAGVNKKTTRPVLLKAKTGEEIALVGDGNNEFLLDGGGAFIVIDNGADFSLTDFGGNVYVVVTPAGELTLGSKASTDLTLNGQAGAVVQLGAGGSLILSASAGSNPTIQYTPGNPIVWAIAAPSSLANAVDRLAQALSNLLGVPIP